MLQLSFSKIDCISLQGLIMEYSSIIINSKIKTIKHEYFKDPIIGIKFFKLICVACCRCKSFTQTVRQALGIQHCPEYIRDTHRPQYRQVTEGAGGTECSTPLH